MRRRDSLGHQSTPFFETIANCESRDGSIVDLDAHEYRSYRVAKFVSETERAEYLMKVGRTAIQVESVTIDNGEQKIFFGFRAKHLVTKAKRKDTGDEMTLAGWYIEHEAADSDCAPEFVKSDPYSGIGGALVQFPDIAEVHHTGPLPTGLAIKSKLTSKIAPRTKGQSTRTITVEKTVDDLSDEPLNPSVFALPAGLRENPQLLRGHTIEKQ